MRDPRSDRVRLGAFEFDVRAGELRSEDGTVRLQEQPFRILAMLVQADGRLVAREEIRKKLWPNDTVVEFDHSINAAMKRLRRALRDSVEEPRYVETVARRGYRLLAPVEQVNADDLSGGVPAGPSTPRSYSAADDLVARDDKSRAPIDAASLIGKKVSHYRVLSVIGGGGMGLVYKAEDLKLGRQVALKFLPEELASDAASLRRFEREAQTASSLNHPNICTIYEIEEHEKEPFIVMELLEGETLRDRLASEESKAIALDELLDIAIQTCSGLQAAHEKGIIHRDIKPANVFLTGKGVVKILDFGLAKLVEAPTVEEPDFGSTKTTQENMGLRPRRTDVLKGRGLSRAVAAYSFEMGELQCQPGLKLAGDNHKATNGTSEGVPVQDAIAAETTLTRTGTAMGTAGYMSPEQVRGEHLDARTDIFSFGLVLYEMATGQRAFSGETAAIVHDAIVKKAPIPPHDLNAKLPPKLEGVINRALEKDREQRYQTAAELKSELECVKDAGDHDRRRWPLWLAASLVILLAGLATAWFLRRRNGPLREVTERQLTANPQEDYVNAAAISPDGKYVAYHDQTGLYLHSIDSGEVHLVSLPAEMRGQIFGLCWFPGGGKLLAWVSGSDGFDIWVITILGEAAPYLLYRHGREPAISPDGRMVAFTGFEGGKAEQELWVGGMNGEASRKLVAAGKLERVFSPVWSPDGRWIAYGRRWQTAQGFWSSAIEIRPAGGGPAKTLVAESSLKFAMEWGARSWSPDWRLLFCAAERPESTTAPQETPKYSLWEVRVEPRTGKAIGTPARLTPWSDFRPWNLTITTDGKRLSLVKKRTWMDLYLGELGPNGASIKSPRRFTLDDRGSSEGMWTRDGRAILFNSERNGRREIFRQGVLENIAEIVVAGPGDVFGGAMSPDGAWLIYWESEHTRGGEAFPSSVRLMRRSTGSGSPEKVLELPGSQAPQNSFYGFYCSSNPKASSPCVLGLIEEKDYVFYSLDPIRGKGSRLGKIEVTQPPRYVGWGLSADGSRLAFVDQNKYLGRIEVLTLSDGTWHEVSLETKEELLQSIDWAADGKSFFVSSRTPDSFNLLHVTPDGKVQPLLRKGRRQWPYRPHPSPNGRYLAFEAQTWDSNVWIIENF